MKNSLSCISATLLATANKLLIMLIALVALSVGLYFYFDTNSTAGYGIGIAMFVVAGFIYLCGEVMLWYSLKRIKNARE